METKDSVVDSTRRASESRDLFAALGVDTLSYILELATDHHELQHVVLAKLKVMKR